VSVESIRRKERLTKVAFAPCRIRMKKAFGPGTVLSWRLRAAFGMRW